MAEFEIGSKVHIDIDSGIHSGLPDSRYQGLTGEVVGKQGSAFLVDVYQGNKLKQIVVTAAHLKEATGSLAENAVVKKKEAIVLNQEKEAGKKGAVNA